MELKIMQRHYDMMLWAYPALQQFPRSERHVLAADIRQGMYDMLRLMIRANKERDKGPWLRQLDAALELLKTQVRLAHELGYLPHKRYEVWSGYLAELGRMLGGWFKAMAR